MRRSTKFTMDMRPVVRFFCVLILLFALFNPTSLYPQSLQPDLVIHSVTRHKSSYNSGDPIQSTVVVKNQGLAAAGASKMRYYLGTETNKTYRYIQESAVGAIATGATATVTINSPGWPVPGDVPSGKYHIWALADSASGVTESSETNNWNKSDAFYIVQSRSDLIVHAVSQDRASYNNGQKMQANIIIINRGTGTSPVAKLRYYLGSETNQKYRFIEEGSVASIVAGGQGSDQINAPGWTIPYDVPKGTYYLWVQADPSNQIAEIDETNNWGKSSAFSIPAEVLPDIVVKSISGLAKSYDVGDRLTASIKVKNDGDGHARRTKMKIYLGTQNDKTLHLINETTVKELVSGNSVTESIDSPGWEIPSDTVQANYFLWVQVDVEDTVREMNEINNWGQSASFTVLGGPAPDLSVQTVSTDKSGYGIKGSIKASASIKNNGNLASPAAKVSFYLGTADNQTFKLMKEVSLGSVKAGGSNSVSVGAKGWSINQNIPTGTYSVYVQADSANALIESDESNNWNQSGEFTITANRPDLYVDSVTKNKTRYKVGDSLSAAVVIKNDGPQPAASSRLKYYLGTPENRSYRLIRNGQVGVIDSQASASHSLASNTWTVPADIPTGPYYVWIQVDSAGRILEGNETNNWGRSSLIVVANPADQLLHSQEAVVMVGISPGGGRRLALTPDDRYLYVPNSGDGTVSVIDTSVNTEVNRLHVGGTPLGIIASPDGRHVYAADYGGNSITSIDTQVQKIASRFELAGTPADLAIDPDGRSLYVTLMGRSDLAIVQVHPVLLVDYMGRDRLTGEVTHTANFPQVSLDPQGRILYLFAGRFFDLSLYDAPLRQFKEGINWGNFYGKGLLLADSGTRLYIGAGEGIRVIDPATLLSTHSIEVPVKSPDQLLGMVLSPDECYLYISDSINNQVIVFNTTDFTVADRIPVGIAPLSMAISSDGCYLYVANRGDNTVSVIRRDFVR